MGIPLQQTSAGAFTLSEEKSHVTSAFAKLVRKDNSVKVGGSSPSKDLKIFIRRSLLQSFVKTDVTWGS